ncbi:MAG: ABC transporter permease [Spirochaetaceae bacterium]|jgi:putative ABC transport system permease protein|nr:ABC transporter permease [Spirochaetaceae bacterium]
MNTRILNTNRLALRNLKAKPVRSVCLAVIVAVLAFTLFGGAVLAMNFSRGLDIMTKRFGADLMVVPEGAAENAQAVLLRGEPRYFYFDSGIVETLAGMEGIARASAQFFLTSLAESCCDARLQLIAYDPSTDFVLQPWFAEQYTGRIEDGQVVAGSRITLSRTNSIRLLNHTYPVAARLSKSASGLDTSVFMTMNTMRQLIAQAKAEGYDFLAVQDREMRQMNISAVLVKTAPGQNPRTLAAAIRRANAGVEVLVSQSVFSSIGETLSGFISYIRLFSVLLWILAILILTVAFSGSIHERKKEFAILRVLGATRKKLAALALWESFLAGIAGGVAGITLACIIIFPFSVLIGESLGLPYLAASPLTVTLIALSCLFLSALTGPLASLHGALKISRAETYFTMREGE